MNPLSLRVSDRNQSFLEQMAGLGKSKTETVNDALDFLRKAKLRNDLTALATDSPESDAALANEDMKDYFTILEDAA